MEIFPSKLADLSWDSSKDIDVDVAARAGVGSLVAAVPGVDLAASMGTIFQRAVQSHWSFSRLDRYIIQPQRSYIQDCLDTEPVAEHIKRVKTAGHWSLYMITGLVIARGGATTVTAETRRQG